MKRYMGLVVDDPEVVVGGADPALGPVPVGAGYTEAKAAASSAAVAGGGIDEATARAISGISAKESWMLLLR